MFTRLVLNRRCLDPQDARLAPEADLPVERDTLDGREVDLRGTEGIRGLRGEAVRDGPHRWGESEIDRRGDREGIGVALKVDLEVEAEIGTV